jgi:hypothetical protein
MIRAMMFLQKLSSRIVDIVSFAILLFLFAVSLVKTCIIVSDGFENSLYYRDSLLANVFAIVVVILLFYFFNKHFGGRKFRNKGIYIVTSVLYGIVSMYSIYSLVPRADQAQVTDAAAGFLSGDYSMWKYGGYCYRFTNQNGLIFYFVLLFLVFGVKNYLAIYAVNTLLYFVTVCLIRGIVAFYTAETAVLDVVWAAVLLYYPMICYNGFAYGTIPGQFFSLLAVYLYFRFSRSDGRYGYTCLLFSGLSIFAAVCLKMNYMIAAVAMILVCAVRVFSERSVKQMIAVVIFAVSLAAGAKVPNMLMERVTGNPTDEGIPAVAWVEMGLQTVEYTSAGWWNDYNFKIYLDGGGGHDLTEQLALEDLKETCAEYRKDPASFFCFLYRKITSQWINPDFQGHGLLFNRSSKDNLLHWIVDDDSRFYPVYIWVLDRFMSVVYFGSLCFLIARRKEPDIASRIGYIIFLGGFLFHLFWEGKCQYTLPYFIWLIPCAICGLWKLTVSINEQSVGKMTE